MIRTLQLGEIVLKLAKCSECQKMALCWPLREKRKGGKWRKSNVCTKCVPIRQEIFFADHLVVIKKEKLRAIFRVVKYASNAAMKLGIALYAQKKGLANEKKKEITIAFDD